MSFASYRKYRPQRFAEVIGQDIIRTIIRNAVAAGQVAHAYLFTGPRGVGKTTVARILAKAVNCRNSKDGEPDTTCENCVAVQEGRFLDLIEIDAASYTGVDNIRDIIDHVKFTPSRGAYKVFIVDEVHMLSKAAFNALLKTLEEPPQHAIFVLATTEIHKVPATIISRSQRFDFHRVSQTDIQKVLKKVSKDIDCELAPEALALVAEAADGSFRDALSLLDQLASFGSAKMTLEDVEDILGITRIAVSQRLLNLLIKADTQVAANFVKSLVLEGKDPIQFNKNLLEYLRLVLYVKLAVEKIEDLGLIAEEEQDLREQCERLSPARLLLYIRQFLNAYRDAKTSPVPELPLLAAILALSSEGAPEPATPVPKKPTKSAEIPAGASGPMNQGKVLERWSEVLARIKEYNHSLLSSLRLARIMSCDQKELVLAFPYNFHKDTVAARKNRIVVEKVLEEVFGLKMKISAVLEKEVAASGAAKSSPRDLLSEAERVLGKNQDSY